MRLGTQRSLAVLALCGALGLPAVSIGSCGGGGGGTAIAESGTTSTSSATGTGGGGGNTTGVLIGSGGGSTATCGGPPATDAGDDGPTGCEGLDGGLGFDAVAPLFVGCQGETCHPAPWTQPELVDIPANECCDGRFLVQPGDPNRSYLVDKLLGDGRCNPTRMPLNGPPYFSAAEMLLIQRWICGGAPAN